MKRNFFYLFLIILLFSCERKEENIIAQVNNEILLEKDMIANFGKEGWEELPASKKDEFIQDWIKLTLLAQEADKHKISKTDEIKQRILTAEKNIKANALISQKLANVEISEDDLFNYYKMHQNQFKSSFPEYKVQRIFTKDQEKLTEIRNEIAASSFTEAAKKYSEEPAGKNGGYIGWISEETIAETFWNVLSNLKKYHYKTVKHDNGFYIIRYYDEREIKKEKKFTDVSAEIKKIVIKNRQDEIFQNVIDELKKKSQISISN